MRTYFRFFIEAGLGFQTYIGFWITVFDSPRASRHSLDPDVRPPYSSVASGGLRNSTNSSTRLLNRNWVLSGGREDSLEKVNELCYDKTRKNIELYNNSTILKTETQQTEPLYFNDNSSIKVL